MSAVNMYSPIGAANSPQVEMFPGGNIEASSVFKLTKNKENIVPIISCDILLLNLLKNTVFMG
jgi:hypothetical protein